MNLGNSAETERGCLDKTLLLLYVTVPVSFSA